VSLIALAASVLIGQATPSITDYTQTQFKDCTFVWNKSKADQRELQKINKDFAQSYRFKTVSVWVREPWMMRLETEVDDTKVYFIINGTDKLYKVPQAKISHKESVAGAPGKRQTAFDFGVITPVMFKEFFTSKFVRKERGTNEMVFDLMYDAKDEDSSRHRVWVSPETKLVTKREWYSQNGGHLMATFLYESPKKIGNVWLPTKLSVKNSENKVAGVSEFTGLKANIGIDADFFSMK
jgi:outer membrane lipoprotein-sorting protein